LVYLTALVRRFVTPAPAERRLRKAKSGLVAARRGRAAQDNADHLAFLLQLCELELIERERKSEERRLKAFRFPAHKLLDEFDFAARPQRQ